MTFPEKLRRLSTAKRLNQAALARAVGGISKSTMFNWFNGVNPPDLYSALRMARVLGVSLDYLADDNLDEPPAPSVSEEERAILEVVRALELPKADVLRLLYGRAPSLSPRARSPHLDEGDTLDEGADLTQQAQRLMRDASRPKKSPRTPTIIDTTERDRRKRSG